jgi:ABC-type uncharacterized transport system auxiliary subunit
LNSNPKARKSKQIHIILFGILMACIAAGCFPKGTASPPVRHYTLEYPSPQWKGLKQVNATIRVERFFASPPFDTQAMLYRPVPYRYGLYNYYIWVAKPADLVSDFLLRDMQSSGLFRAVYSDHALEDARYLIDGGISEFFEDDEQGPSAKIALNLVLFDMSHKEIDRKVIFQKTYTVSEPSEKTADGLARGMSQAMSRLSKSLITDIYAAILRGSGEERVSGSMAK